MNEDKQKQLKRIKKWLAKAQMGELIGLNPDNRSVKYADWLIDELEELEKEAFGYSWQITYLEGVIDCAVGEKFPSDIGCENHSLNKMVKANQYELERSRREVDYWKKRAGHAENIVVANDL